MVQKMEERKVTQGLEPGTGKRTMLLTEFGDSSRMKEKGGRWRDSFEIPIGCPHEVVCLEIRTEAWDADLDIINLEVDGIYRCGNEWYICLYSSKWPCPHNLLLRAFHIFTQISSSTQGPSWFSSCLSFYILDRPSPWNSIGLPTGLPNVSCSLFSWSLCLTIFLLHEMLHPFPHHWLAMYPSSLHVGYTPWKGFQNPLR